MYKKYLTFVPNKLMIGIVLFGFCLSSCKKCPYHSVNHRTDETTKTDKGKGEIEGKKEDKGADKTPFKGKGEIEGKKEDKGADKTPFKGKGEIEGKKEDKGADKTPFKGKGEIGGKKEDKGADKTPFKGKGEIGGKKEDKGADKTPFKGKGEIEGKKEDKGADKTPFPYNRYLKNLRVIMMHLVPTSNCQFIEEGGEDHYSITGGDLYEDSYCLENVELGVRKRIDFFVNGCDDIEEYICCYVEVNKTSQDTITVDLYDGNNKLIKQKSLKKVTKDKIKSSKYEQDRVAFGRGNTIWK